MFEHPTAEILEERIHRLFEHLKKAGEAFDTAIIIGKVNQYYLTGTMQDGALVLRRDGTAAFFVRKSYDRAKMESPLGFLYPINSYKDMKSVLPDDLGSTYIETEVVPLALLERLRKHFVIGEIHSIDRILFGFAP
jgi:Xaa-Pro aminopeptidase